MLYRVVFIALVIGSPINALFAQTVADLMPLAVGQYVRYNQFDTATAGTAPTKSNAYYEVFQNGLSFQGATGVSLIYDTLGAGDPSGAHNLHYSFTSLGDLQVYADTAMYADILPAALAAGVKQPSNRWIPRYKTSQGMNVVYPIDTINTTYTSGSQSANVQIIFSGKYVGSDNITVSGINYPTAYRFELLADLTITESVITLGTLHLDESDWLVKGIGIVRTSLPLDSTKLAFVGTTVSAGGRDKEMIANGVSSSSVAAQPMAASEAIRVYPNPASDQVTLTFDRPAKSIFLYDDAGQMIRSFALSSHTADALLWTQDIPNGGYIARVIFSDGSEESEHLIVRH